MAAGTSIESSIRFNQIFWFGVIAFFALCTGFFLASNRFTLALAVVSLGWLVLLPYHAKLASYLSIITFKSALILPYFPGRPYMWEFAAFLAWSGLGITISLRRYAPDAAKYIRENRWLFIGILIYCVVLIVTMSHRGFGLRIMGTDQMGGRFYFQQLMCAIFPVLFILVRLPELTLVRLYIFQCLLTLTFLVSDFVFSLGGGGLFGLLQFFELPGDAANFERQAQQFGIRRFQSLNAMGQGLILLILVFYKLDAFFSRKALYLFPLAVTIFGVGLLSGHRYLSLILGIAVLFIAYTQRFYNTKNTLISLGLSVTLLVPLILFANRLPLSAQRALSYIPYIKIDERARYNGATTMKTRRILRAEGYRLIPQYFWIGRGFTMPSRDYSHIWDQTFITMHINQGKFYNGFIGLMVNTGVFGTISMLIFMAAGSYLAISIINSLRRHGCDDAFARMSCVVASVWMANIIAFLFFHGDSEFAMKTFSLQAGLMIACKRCLDYRTPPRKHTEEEPAGETLPPSHRHLHPAF